MMASKEKDSEAPSLMQVNEAIAASYQHVLAAKASYAPEVFDELIASVVKGSRATRQPDSRSIKSVAEARERQLLARLVVLLTGWASFDSVDHLVRQLERNSYKICVDGWGATLSDVLFYLQAKGHFPKYKFQEVYHIEKASETEPCWLLADTMVLRRLRDWSFFGHQARRDNEAKLLRLVMPFGYEGVNMFNAALPLITARVTEWHRDVLVPLLDQPTDDEARDDDIDRVIDAIHAHTIKMLPEKVLSANRDITIKFVYPPRFDFLSSGGTARKQFLALSSDELVRTHITRAFESAPPTLHTWRALFDTYEGDTRTQFSIAQTLSKALFYSMRSLSGLSEHIHRQLTDLLDQLKPEQKIDKVQFVIPKRQKSYGLATLLFFMNLPHLSTERIYGVRTGFELQKNDPVVILDDFAGSGQSLVTAAREAFLRVDQPLMVFAAPLLQTHKAKLVFDQFHTEVGTKHRRLFYSLPGVQLTAEDSDYDEIWMGAAGHDSGMHFISFEYMAPDNNCAFMAFEVAPLFTLGGRGVKFILDTPPPGYYTKFIPAVLQAKQSSAPATFLSALLSRATTQQFSPRTLHTFICASNENPSYLGRYPVILRYLPDGPSALSSRFRTSKFAALQLSDVVLNAKKQEGGEEQEAESGGARLYSWILNEDRQLLFGALTDNPLQLGGASPAELARSLQVFGFGEVEVTETALKFTLHPAFAPDGSKLQAAIKYLTRHLDHRVTLHRMSNSAARPATKADFEKACELGYELRVNSKLWQTDQEKDGPRPDADDACKLDFSAVVC